MSSARTGLRFTLPQLLMAVTLVAILLSFTQCRGCGKPFQRVSHVVFSPDGTTVVATVYSGRDANVRLKYHVADVARTVELLGIDGGTDTLGMKGSRRHVLQYEERRGTLGVLSVIEKGSSVGFDRSGSRMAVLHWGYRRRSGADTVSVWDRQSHLPGPPQKIPEAVTLAMSPQGDILALHNGAEIVFWSMTTQQVLHRVPSIVFDPDGPALAFSPNGKIVAVGSMGATMVDVQSGQTIGNVTWKDALISCRVHFSPEGDCLAVADRSRLLLHDLRSGEERTLFLAKDDSISDSDFAPDGRTLAVAFPWRGEVVLLDRRNGQHRGRLPEPAWVVAYSPDGRFIATGGPNGRVALWDSASLRQVRVLRTEFTGLRIPWLIPAAALLTWIAVARRMSRHRRSSTAQVVAGETEETQ